MLLIYNLKPNFQTLLNPCIKSINNLYNANHTIKRARSLPNISYANPKDG